MLGPEVPLLKKTTFEMHNFGFVYLFIQVLSYFQFQIRVIALFLTHLVDMTLTQFYSNSFSKKTGSNFEESKKLFFVFQ